MLQKYSPSQPPGNSIAGANRIMSGVLTPCHYHENAGPWVGGCHAEESVEVIGLQHPSADEASGRLHTSVTRASMPNPYVFGYSLRRY